jgi:protein-disulfide isomerase
MIEINIIEKHWYKKWWGVLLIIIGSLILINLVAFGFYIWSMAKDINSGSNGQINQAIKYSDLDKKTVKKIEGENNYWIGSANPKITIIEFADFNCQFCKNSFPTIREIGLKYKDSVKIIFRDMPLLDGSVDLALAARCAGEQGLFWPMHDKLYLNQGVESLEKLYELANQIGADNTKLQNCFKGKRYLSQINKNFSDGDELGVTGTPTWFINGTKVAGDIPPETWEEIISQILFNK